MEPEERKQLIRDGLKEAYVFFILMVILTAVVVGGGMSFFYQDWRWFAYSWLSVPSGIVLAEVVPLLCSLVCAWGQIKLDGLKFRRQGQKEIQRILDDPKNAYE